MQCYDTQEESNGLTFFLINILVPTVEILKGEHSWVK